jgi:hypothetical protein
MPAPNRFDVVACAALAVATPVVAGAAIWRHLDPADRHGVGYLLLYWPSLLLDALPGRVAEAFARSALPTVLLYFGGYLALAWLLRGVARAWAGRRRAIRARRALAAAPRRP